MKIEFSSSDNNVVIAYFENSYGEPILAGKHFVNSGLSWNLPSRVRYTATLEEWKDNAKNRKYIR